MNNETQTNVGPPPAPEVALRTLASDAKAIAAGQAVPTPMRVQPDKASAPDKAITKEKGPKKKSGSLKIFFIILAIVILVGAGAATFYLLTNQDQGQEATLEVQG